MKFGKYIATAVAALLVVVFAENTMNVIIQDAKLTIKQKDVFKPRFTFRAMLLTKAQEVKKPIIYVAWLARGRDGVMELRHGTLVNYSVQQERGSSGSALTSSSPDKISQKQTIVSVAQYKSLQVSNDIYMPGNGGQNGDLLCFRVELWIDGLMVAAKDSHTPASLKQSAIPENWYILGENKYKITIVK